MIHSFALPQETLTKSEFLNLIDTVSASMHAGHRYKQQQSETLDAFLDRMEKDV